jgi:hypothetical protein
MKILLFGLASFLYCIMNLISQELPFGEDALGSKQYRGCYLSLLSYAKSVDPKF